MKEGRRKEGRRKEEGGREGGREGGSEDGGGGGKRKERVIERWSQTILCFQVRGKISYLCICSVHHQ